jgi:hypothetical protein
MTPLIYVLMCLAGGPASLDLTADERFWRDEQSCVIVRNNLQKECACVPFIPGSNANASATVIVTTHDATPVAPREKIEDKSKPAAKHEQKRPPRHHEQQVPIEPSHYQEDRGFGGFGWGTREW